MARRRQSWFEKNKETIKESSKFIASIISGIVIVTLFGFFQDGVKPTIIDSCTVLRLNPPPSPERLEFWECWEIGALLWSATTSAIYYFSTSPIRSVFFNKLYVLLLTFGMFGLHWVAALYLFSRPPQMSSHIWAVIGIGIIFALIDGLIFYFQAGNDPKEKRERMEALESLLFADVPMIVAFFIFLRFSLGEHGLNPKTDIFLSGAISFQFVASTFVFAFIQGGLYTKVKRRMEKAAPKEKRKAEEVADDA